jgi:hypothetical protein
MAAKKKENKKQSKKKGNVKKQKMLKDRRMETAVKMTLTARAAF